MKQSSFIKWAVLMLMFLIVGCYDIVGAWQLVTQPGRYQFLSDSLAYQFAKSVDANGMINTKLFVYDCFLSQFLYEMNQDQLSLNFQTSSLFTQDCSLSAINELRSLMQKIFYFQIVFDRLFLLSLNRETVFELKRQKFNYTEIMAGAWIMSNAQGTSSYPARINGSNINICSNQAQLSYTVSTINGSYPNIKNSLLASTECSDSLFLAAIQKSAFFTIAENLTQLTLYDSSGGYLITLDQIAKIRPNQSLSISQRPSVQIKQNSQQQTSLTINIPQSQTVTTNNNPSIPVPNQSSYLTQQQQAIQASTSYTQSYLETPILVPQKQDNAESQQRVSVPQQTYGQQQTVQTPQQNFPTSQNYSTIQQSIPTFQQQRQQSSAISWTFNDNGVFSGSFSSIPLFSFDTSANSQTIKPAGAQDNQSNNKTNYQNQGQNEQSQSISPTQQPSERSDTNQLSTQASNTSFITLQQLAETSTGSSVNTISTSTVSSLINLSMSSINNGTATSDFVVANKWLLTWLNGYNSLQQFSRVYMIFTSTKIILYCPCNTYYTSYRLQEGYLQGVSWLGTSNQCEVNNDRQVTDFIFYSNLLRQKGANLAFYYNNQAQLAEFKPYY